MRYVTRSATEVFVEAKYYDRAHDTTETMKLRFDKRDNIERMLKKLISDCGHVLLNWSVLKEEECVYKMKESDFKESAEREVK